MDLLTPMTDRELLIQLNTNVNNLCDKTTEIQEHVAVMNAEQGNQANKIVAIETQMSIMMWITTAIAVAVIGQITEMIFRKINEKKK